MLMANPHSPEWEGSDTGRGREACKTDQRRLSRDLRQRQPLRQRPVSGWKYIVELKNRRDIKNFYVAEHCAPDRNTQWQHGGWRGEEILLDILSPWKTSSFLGSEKLEYSVWNPDDMILCNYIANVHYLISPDDDCHRCWRYVLVHHPHWQNWSFVFLALIFGYSH